MGFWKWFFTGAKSKKGKDKVSCNKQVSLGLSYELQRLFGLIETIDEKNAKLKSLNAEKTMLDKMIRDYNQIEDKVENDSKKFKNNIQKLQIILNNIHVYEDKLDNIDKSMDKLSIDIKNRAKDTENDIIELKKQALVFKNIEEKIEEQKQKVKKELEELREKIKKQEGKRAIGYSAVLLGPVDLEKIKKPTVKKIVKEEHSSIKLTTNVVIPDIEEKPRRKHKKKPKRAAKAAEAKKRIAKKKVIKEIIKKKVKPEKLEEKAEEISEAVVEEALSEGVEPRKPYKPVKTGVETEIDQVLRIVREKGKVSFSKLAKEFKEKMATIEQWAEALEEKEFIEIIYPIIGSPYMKLKK